MLGDRPAFKSPFQGDLRFVVDVKFTESCDGLNLER